MSSRYCPKCFMSNLSEATACVDCGASLTALSTSSQQGSDSVPPSPGVPPPLAPNPYFDYAVSYFEADRRRKIDRTKTGLLLLVIGFFLSWVPFVGVIGSILEIVGALMVIIGRHAFGPAHARNVLWSLVIFIVGIVVAIVTVTVLVLSAIFSNPAFINRTPGTIPPSLVFDRTTFYTGIFIGLTIAQVSYVLLTYALQGRTGRMLLWVGYAASISANLVNFFVFTGSVLLSAVPSLVPALIFGLTYNLARIRVDRGEMPGPPVPLSPQTSSNVPQ